MKMLLLTLLAASYAEMVWGECGCPKPDKTYGMGTDFPTSDKNGLIEGDILLNPEQRRLLQAGPKFRNMVVFQSRLWPGGVVPYKLTNWKHKIISWNIRSALRKLSKKTGGCVRFREANSSDKHYVKVIYGSGCYSRIGRNSESGGQPLSLGFGCELHSTIQHEFMHALGIHHEQTRPDRDDNIIVKWKNIETDSCYNFKKYGRVPPLPYDLKSVMHYGSMAFSCKLGKSTMRTLDDKIIGGALGGTFYPNSLTDLDAKKIKWLYGCK